MGKRITYGSSQTISNQRPVEKNNNISSKKPVFSQDVGFMKEEENTLRSTSSSFNATPLCPSKSREESSSQVYTLAISIHLNPADKCAVGNFET